MTYMFTVSPDFSPDHLSGWYIFNTWVQRSLGIDMHLELYGDFHSQKQAILEDKIDLIYANPYDAAVLVREKQFVPLVKPEGHSDEAIIAVHNESNINKVEDLQAGTRVAATDDPDVMMMGMIMLEPADLDKDNVNFIDSENYVLVAKNLINNKADVGIFLDEAYDDFSKFIKNQLHILVRSQISVINHALLIGPNLADKRDQLLADLMAMNANEKGKGVLESLGFTKWQALDDEQMEFMIDLMDTLTI